MFYICIMKTLKIELSNGTFVCRSGKIVCEKKSSDKDYRIFKVDKTEIKLQANEIKDVKIER